MVDNVVASPWFQVIGLPLALMIIGVMARRLGRRDGDDSPRRNDWAVGTTVLLMALGAVVADLRSFPDQTSILLGWLAGILCATFVFLEHDRSRSWVRDPINGLPTKDKRVWVGIIIPDVLCLAVFVFYQARKVNLV